MPDIAMEDRRLVITIFYEGPWRRSRRSDPRGLRHRARGRQAHPRPAPFRRAADRRHGPARGPHRRDEDRRRQDAGRHACPSISMRSPARACMSSPSTIISPSATRPGWARSTSSSGSPSAASCTTSTTTQRRAQYACDVTYGTNNEFGFDYLRDNMKYSAAEMVQRGHYFAIVDEVDSILIDEARTPLIISGPARRPLRALQHHRHLHPQARARPITSSTRRPASSP